jgi:replicative DNA helicase
MKPARQTKEYNPELGQIPPQATDLEEVVLGALLLDKTTLMEVIDQLEEVTFYKIEHQLIFKAIKQLYQTSQVDILTVTNQLRTTGELEQVGGAFYIASLTNRLANTTNIQEWIAIIRQKFMQREMIRISQQVIKEAFEDTTDVFDLMEYAEQSIISLQPAPRRSTALPDIAKRAMQDVLTASKDTHTTGMSIGYGELDYYTGLTPANLIILAARPSMGKTALALNIARFVANKYPVGIFSLEMSDTELYKRMVSSETEIPLNRVIRGDMADYEWMQVTNKDAELRGLPIQIDDSGTVNLFDLRVKARRWKAKFDIQLLIIDYLQLMAGKQGGNREQEISSISRGLKALSKELNIPILALSQLSRECERRPGKKPLLSDLRESGGIEQDADVVIFLYREVVYDKEADPEDCEPIIAKNRNGKTGTAHHLRFIDKYVKFESYNKDNAGQPIKPSTMFDNPAF